MFHSAEPWGFVIFPAAFAQCCKLKLSGISLSPLVCEKLVFFFRMFAQGAFLKRVLACIRSGQSLPSDLPCAFCEA